MITPKKLQELCMELQTVYEKIGRELPKKPVLPYVTKKDVVHESERMIQYIAQTAADSIRQGLVRLILGYALMAHEDEIIENLINNYEEDLDLATLYMPFLKWL